MKPFIFILVLAAFAVGQVKDSVTVLAKPVTKTDVLRVSVLGYDTTKIFTCATISAGGLITISPNQEILPYVENDTINNILFSAMGKNLRWTYKDLGADSVTAKAFLKMCNAKLKARVILK